MSAAQETTIDRLSPVAIQERIKKLRLGTPTVQTKPGADVEIRQALSFGTAIANWPAENDPIAIFPSGRKMLLELPAGNINYASIKRHEMA